MEQAAGVGTHDGTIVLVMGHGATKTQWIPLAESFASKGFYVITFDNRGAGCTTVPGQDSFGATRKHQQPPHSRQCCHCTAPCLDRRCRCRSCWCGGLAVHVLRHGRRRRSSDEPLQRAEGSHRWREYGRANRDVGWRAPSRTVSQPHYHHVSVSLDGGGERRDGTEPSAPPLPAPPPTPVHCVLFIG